MQNYMLTYHDAKMPTSPEEGAKQMAEWEAWADSLGNSLINRGTPLGQAKTVKLNSITDGCGESTMNGYSILSADNIEAAVKLVENSPHVIYGGTMVVAEMMEMKGC